MDINQKLHAAVDNYNGLLEREQKLEQQLKQVHEERLAALGRVQALDELFKEQIAAMEFDTGQNGSEPADDAVEQAHE